MHTSAYKAAIIAAIVLMNLKLFSQETIISDSAFPILNLSLNIRDPQKSDLDKFSLFESDIKKEILSIEESTPLESKPNRVFFLFENSHTERFTQQRAFFKSLLSESIEAFNDLDVFFFSEFDWTQDNGDVIDTTSLVSLTRESLREKVEAIQTPNKKSDKEHKSTELYMGLDEALGYLGSLGDQDSFSNSIVVLSAEFSNIFNNSVDPEDIIKKSKELDIPIYSVRYPGMGLKYSLSDISNETYAAHLSLNENPQVKDYLKSFKQMLSSISKRAQGRNYLISYETDASLGGSPLNISVSHESKIGSITSYDYAAPDYFEWILMRKVRLLVFGLFLVLFIFTIFLGYRFISKRLRHVKNEQNVLIQNIEDRSNKQIEDQKKFIQDLEEKRQKDETDALMQEVALRHQESKERFENLARSPFLSLPDGSHIDLQIDNILGRVQDKNCQIGLGDASVSRTHAGIFFEKTSIKESPKKHGQFYLVDLNSTNGTLLNQALVTEPVALKNGDIINIGAVSIAYRD